MHIISFSRLLDNTFKIWYILTNHCFCGIFLFMSSFSESITREMVSGLSDPSLLSFAEAVSYQMSRRGLNLPENAVQLTLTPEEEPATDNTPPTTLADGR